MALLGHTFGDTHESYEHVELPLKRLAIKKLDAWRKAEAKKKEAKKEKGETNVTPIREPDDRTHARAYGD